MIAQIFKKCFQVAFLTGCFISVIARINGWKPTIASVEAITSKSPVICFFHYFTGWDCPGCGMTRAIFSFFAGDVGLSFYFHPVGPLAGLIICYLFFISWQKKRHWSPNRWIVPRWSVSILLILMAWVILRN
jgi:Protein of unknown function (DUF2752)